MGQALSNGGQGTSCKKSCAGKVGRGVREHDLWCPEDADLSEAGTYGGYDFIEASNDIASTAVVPSAGSIKYRAGNAIRLEPGFHASAGADFHAFIHPCDAPGNSFNPKSLPSHPTSPEPTLEVVNISALKVYPNPSWGLFMVEITPADEDMTMYFTVFDAVGHIVASAISSNGKGQFDLSGRSGLFLILAETGGFRSSTRIIIE